MPAKIGIVSAGSMGAAVGHRMVQNGFEVYTPADGRSESTMNRAEKASMTILGNLENLLSVATILLSILPPSDAVDFAQLVVDHLKVRDDRGNGFTFVDCNAISPDTSRKIATLFKSQSYATFIDGSIVGGPPRNNYSPVFYLSSDEGNAAALANSLTNCGLSLKVLSGPIGAASALKMSYAGLTKGLSALAALSVFGAMENDVLPDLLAELATSNQNALRVIEGSGSSLPLKAYRWVGEMQEIGAYLSDAGISEGRDVYEGIAKVFERVEREKNGEAVRKLNEASKEATLAKQAVHKAP